MAVCPDPHFSSSPVLFLFRIDEVRLEKGRAGGQVLLYTMAIWYRYFHFRSISSDSGACVFSQGLRVRHLGLQSQKGRPRSRPPGPRRRSEDRGALSSAQQRAARLPVITSLIPTSNATVSYLQRAPSEGLCVAEWEARPAPTH